MAPMGSELKTVYLASNSPRRLLLLESCGLVVHRLAQDADETWPNLGLDEAVEEIARRKLRAVKNKLVGPTVSADTVVVLDDKVLGKPGNEAEAEATIAKLAGRHHRVITGVCVGDGENEGCFSVVTQVWFRPLTLMEVKNYVARGESLDKAGAYGIQGFGAALIDKIEGSYTNVVGLPLAETLAALKALG